MKKNRHEQPSTTQSIGEDRLIRAVASSTAIETGESIQELEERLKSGRGRFRHLKLAD